MSKRRGAATGILQRPASRSYGWKTIVLGGVPTLALAGWYLYLSNNRAASFSGPISLYTDSLQKNPESSELHNNLGDALERSGEYVQALFHFRNAVRLKPTNARAFHNLGVALSRTGDREQAVQCFERSIELRPDLSVGSRNQLAKLLLASGQQAEAIEQYEAALQIDPASAGTENNLGIALINSGRPSEAIKHLSRATELAPEFGGAYLNLAEAYLRTGQKREAVAAALRGIEVAEENGEQTVVDAIKRWLKVRTGEP